MAAFISGLILVVIFFLGGTPVGAEVPALYPLQDSITTKKAIADHRMLQLITRLEQIAENEMRELNVLAKRVESVVSQVTEIQSLLSLDVAEPDEEQAGSANSFNVQYLTDPVTLSVKNAQHLEDSILPDETGDAPTGIPLSPDNLFLVGMLLTLLIVITILRDYRGMRERLTRSTDAPPSSGMTERYPYEALLLRRNDKNKIAHLPESTLNATNQARSEEDSLIEQDKPEAAIQLLQKQLAINRYDISGWLRLFELLYKSGNKEDFKKNARRFKRLGQFPDLWVQVQDLGHRLDPNEPLYFDERKRKEKFFPNSTSIG